VIGAEFMTTSVTSAGVLDSINAALKRKPHSPKLDIPIGNELVGAINPHIRFADLGSHGYSVMTFTDAYAEWTAYVVDKNKPKGFVRERVFRRLRTFADSTELREMPALDGLDRLQRLG
jgi:alkaline phosphatase D